MIYLFKLILIKIPECYIFKNFYFLLKRIKTKNKNKLIYKNIIYNFVITNVLGSPIWTIHYINTLTEIIFDILNMNLGTKKNQIFIKKDLMLFSIGKLLWLNKLSYLNVARKLRIYFLGEQIHFNPNTSKKIIEKSGKALERVVTTKGSKSKTHFITEVTELEDLQDNLIVSHYPLDYQKSFSVNFENDLRVNKIVYSDLQQREDISYGSGNFYPTPEERLDIKNKGFLVRLHDDNVNVRIHNTGKILNDINYYEALLKLTTNENDKTKIKKSFDEYNSIFTQETGSFLETHEQQLNQILTKDIKLVKNCSNVTELVHHVFLKSRESALWNEYALSDDKRDEMLSFYNEKQDDKHIVTPWWT